MIYRQAVKRDASSSTPYINYLSTIIGPKYV